MKTKYFTSIYLGIALTLIILPTELVSQTTEFNGKTIEFKSLDGLVITADLYLAKESSSNYILLFHQAGWSRGSYREIAPKLNEMGFNCLALDQRSGNAVRDIKNETAARAKQKGLAMRYPDAYPDLQAALNFIYKEYDPELVLIWGSSYSAALSFVLAEKNMEMLDGMLAFSPGEYFKFEDKTISEFAKNLEMPVFVTSSKSEEGRWKAIYEAVPSKYKMSYVPDFEGYHGSRALWEAHEGHEKYWEKVIEFLNLYLKE